MVHRKEAVGLNDGADIDIKRGIIVTIQGEAREEEACTNRRLDGVASFGSGAGPRGINLPKVSDCTRVVVQDFCVLACRKGSIRFGLGFLHFCVFRVAERSKRQMHAWPQGSAARTM